ncbi:hypothetical protein DRJ22_01500 [Candidatus Woesearchaeota archaeon]|nr:MAG: hypothetical protein DRJ22_01500 [Candidatus Woesearchaeota archaeon]
MEYREKVLSLARVSPVLPAQVAKALNTNSLMAGAMLSEMTSKGILKVSNLKVGGSPLYFVPGNEFQLVNFLGNLSPKDREAVLFLKEKKILRDSDLSPLVRTCLRNAKDFALPLDVSFNEKKEIFWKWFLLSDKDAEVIIRDILMPSGVVEDNSSEEKVVKQKVVEENRSVLKEEPKQLVKEKSVSKLKSRPRKRVGKSRQSFWSKVESFFDEHSVEVIEKNSLKRTDFELVVAFDSPFGRIKYFCKALQKAKIKESDLSSAFAKARLKNLPLVFLSNGVLDSGAEKFFGLGLIFKRL